VANRFHRLDSWGDLLTPEEIEEAVRHLRTREDIEAAGSSTLIESYISERIKNPELREELLGIVASLGGAERRGG
jgi:hypothetical protein